MGTGDLCQDTLCLFRGLVLGLCAARREAIGFKGSWEGVRGDRLTWSTLGALKQTPGVWEGEMRRRELCREGSQKLGDGGGSFNEGPAPGWGTAPTPRPASSSAESAETRMATLFAR